MNSFSLRLSLWSPLVVAGVSPDQLTNLAELMDGSTSTARGCSRALVWRERRHGVEDLVVQALFEAQ